MHLRESAQNIPAFFRGEPASTAVTATAFMNLFMLPAYLGAPRFHRGKLLRGAAQNVADPLILECADRPPAQYRIPTVKSNNCVRMFCVGA
jgi:hypothetical protein